MLRRLYHEQPDSFAFSPANQAWAEAQVTKYPEGRQASAIIPLLWRAQEQEGWLSRAAIEHVAGMLDMAYIRALEVATFYFMFQLQPVGSVAHFQICGTTSCMICGAEDLMEVCKEKIARKPHEISADGKFSWEEVECLGSCANAPMAQIGKDYYEDLTPERFAEMIDEMAAGKVPVPGPQNGRYAAEPIGGLTSLTAHDEGKPEHNASVALAVEIGDTLKRIDGTEVPLRTPWQQKPEDGSHVGNGAHMKAEEPHPAEGKPVDETGSTVQEARATETGRPQADASGNRPNAEVNPSDDAEPAGQAAAPEAEDEKPEGPKQPGGGAVDVAEGGETRPEALEGPREGNADDLKLIKGVGPKLEDLLHSLGFYHFDQIANWTPEEIAWVDRNLEGFKGRVTRDDWVSQARALSSGEETEFSKEAKKDGMYRD